MVGWILGWLIWSPQSIVRDTALASMLMVGGDLPPQPDMIGIASRFGDPGDKHIGGNLMCRPDERVSLTEHQCAHRRYACGTILIIENRRKATRSWCEVVDRGPYGANVFTSDGDSVLTSKGRKAWYVKSKKKGYDPPAELCPSGECVGRWRGILDMSPAVSEDLAHNGFEKVRVYRASRVIRYLRYLFKKRDRLST